MIIELKTAIWNTTLIVQCITCKPFEPVDKNGMFLNWHMRDFILIVKDGMVLSEGEVGCYTFATPQEAQAYLDKLLELVELVNKPIPVVDLGETSTIQVGKYTIYINPCTVELADKDDNTIYECKKQLSLPIIKAQLEQILDHLGVKANITI